MISINDISKIPALPGVYLFFDKNNKIIYIGKSKNLKNRVKQYFQNSHDNRLQIELIRKKTVYVDFYTTKTEIEALLLEYNLIQKHKPRYNVKLKDANKYPYICITKEKYPGIIFSWGKENKYECFGPYTSITLVKNIINTLNSIYKLKKCKYKFPHKICIEYEMGNCSAPCVNKISIEDYNNQIKIAKNTLKGHFKNILNVLEENMLIEAKNENFEKAANIRDTIKNLKKYIRTGIKTGMRKNNKDILAIAREKNSGAYCLIKIRDGIINDMFIRRFNVNRKVNDENVIKDILIEYYTNTTDKEIDTLILEKKPEEDISILINDNVKIKYEKFTPFESKIIANAKENAYKELYSYLKRDFIPQSLIELKEKLQLKSIPEYIIGADISHTSGKYTSGAIIMFKNGKPYKSGYRYYKLTNIENNDYKALYEIISRYVKKYRVDLILIDGGKGQLSIGKKVLKDLNMDIPVFALAKRFDILYGKNNFEISLSAKSKSIRLIKDIRDESHRFANKLRKIQMKNMLREKPST